MTINYAVVHGDINAEFAAWVLEAPPLG